MKRDLYHRLYLLVFSIFLTVTSWAQATPSQQTIAVDGLTYPTLSEGALAPADFPGAELTDRGRNIRGIYLPIGKLVHLRPHQLVQWLKKVGADAVIMDIKDDRGRVTFTRKLHWAKGHPHGIVPRMARLVSALKAANIYTIGRLVCFKDNLLHRRIPDAVIRDKRTAKPWRDKTGSTWLDPYSLAAHEYIASIASAAVELGFDEIQLDYVRFPVDGESKYARYPNREGTLLRYEAIALLLARVDLEISRPLSIDVFGLTANRTGDPQGLGQSLEHLAPHIDVISPMLYVANWPRETWENATSRTAYDIVFNAVRKIRARLGDNVAVRPLLQGFKYRAVNFGVGFIATQIDAAQTAGASGHLFWNQSGSYSKVAMAWLRMPPLTPLWKPEVETAETEQPSTPTTEAALPHEIRHRRSLPLNLRRERP